jgi:hypothetical protein
MLLQRKLKQAPSGQTKQPLTLLKELPQIERARIMAILRDHTYEQAQPLVEPILGCPCSVDTLGRFFRWQGTQERLEASDETLGHVAEFIQERYPNWTEEKMRELASTFFTMQAMARGDTRAFASAARLALNSARNQLQERRLEFDKKKLDCKQKLNAKRLDLDERKFEQSLQRKLEYGLEELARHFKKYPEALRIYQQAREMIEEKAAIV